MDLLSILISPSKAKDICCLCYKKSDKITNLDDDIEIHFENNIELVSSLGNIMKNLFPIHELLLTHICEECSTLVIKIYKLFQTSLMKNEMLKHVIEDLNDKIEEIDYKLIFRKNIKKCRLKLNVSSDQHCKVFKDNVKCDKCSMIFRTKFLLLKHIQMTHKTANNAIICHICGKTFPKNFILKAHLKCHERKQCPYCSKVFKSQSYFNFHIKKHKNVSIDTKSISKNIKYITCNQCNYRTVTKTTLEAHINKVHLQIKPFICEICQKGFYKKDNLTQHILTHKKIKDKICDVCGDSFPLNKTLKEHLRLHSGLKPYKCEICNLEFVTSGRRHEHMKRKHMDKEEICDVCNKKFSLKKDLNVHLKNVHGSQFKDS